MRLPLEISSQVVRTPLNSQFFFAWTHPTGGLPLPDHHHHPPWCGRAQQDTPPRTPSTPVFCRQGCSAGQCLHGGLRGAWFPCHRLGPGNVRQTSWHHLGGSCKPMEVACQRAAVGSPLVACPPHSLHPCMQCARYRPRGGPAAEPSVGPRWARVRGEGRQLAWLCARTLKTIAMLKAKAPALASQRHWQLNWCRPRCLGGPSLPPVRAPSNPP